MSKNHNFLSSFSKSINSFAANIGGILKPKPQPTPTMISFTTPSLLRRLHKPLALVAGLGLFALGTNAQTTLLSHYTLDGNGTDGGSIGADGAPNGTGSASYVSGGVGKFSHALSTTGGTQDYFTAATGDKTAFGLDKITIALWMNITSGAPKDRLVSNITSSSGF